VTAGNATLPRRLRAAKLAIATLLAAGLTAALACCTA
jgi:hypothetical protein